MFHCPDGLPARHIPVYVALIGLAVVTLGIAVAAPAAMDAGLDEDLFDLSIAGGESGGEDGDHMSGNEAAATSGRRRLMSDQHSVVHAAAIKHAAHKLAGRARIGKAKSAPAPAQAQAEPTVPSTVTTKKMAKLAPSGVSLPNFPKRPPVCSVPPAMRFCKNVDYPVYRPDEDHTFADLDFDSHAVYKKIVPHMRISERHFELPVIHQCRANFRKFLCLRNFPRCCHVGLCNRYGDSNDPLTTAFLSHMPDIALKKNKATTVTFLAGSRDKMKIDKGANDTVQVKVADATCLQYVQTYAPLFDCRSQCHELLSNDCLFMLSQECSELCMGVHTQTCANKALYQMATGQSGASTLLSSTSVAVTSVTVLVLAMLQL